MMITILMITQFIFTIIMGIYFSKALNEKTCESAKFKRGEDKELLKLKNLRDIKLTLPLSEKTRPKTLEDVVGQEKGIRALRAALCGPNPQHVIIYGSPGVGKTAAARLILEEAKKEKFSPFTDKAKFIETDATVMRFDERNIADPLIGSVHDPIYQGAGSYGPAGIPKPKPGAVTKAHGGILFIDEIGELHPNHINKLLKVLEDRKVYLESAYYSPEDDNLPLHIHEIFKNGLPADFRLIGATTCSPDEIPPAIRSRCVEIFFNDLSEEEIRKIAHNAIERSGFKAAPEICSIVSDYSSNGRDAVNMVQTAISLCMIEHRDELSVEDIEWVIETGKYSKRIDKKLENEERCGCISGLAVAGSRGIVIDVEAVISEGTGIFLSGITEGESVEIKGRKLEKTSSAKASVANALVVLKKDFGIDLIEKRVNINIPGGTFVDGPSAGIAIFCALYSAAANLPVSSAVTMTGEISICGKVKPVGGVAEKISGAISAGAQTVIIPEDNKQENFDKLPISVEYVSDAFELVKHVFENGQKIGDIAV
ncbi:MAG: ATP-dependent protease LonB [Monoglobales bacterium]